MLFWDDYCNLCFKFLDDGVIYVWFNFFVLVVKYFFVKECSFLLNLIFLKYIKWMLLGVFLWVVMVDLIEILIFF